jgi:hypothetical protein
MRVNRRRFVSALGIVIIGLGLALTGCDDPPTAGIHHDEKTCRAEGGTVHEHEQWGGKFNKSTWWCTNPNGDITGIWFES